MLSTITFFFFLKQGKKVKSWFWLFHLCNTEKKNGTIGLHGGETNAKDRVRSSAQCFILFGFGQECSFRCIPNSCHIYWPLYVKLVLKKSLAHTDIPHYSDYCYSVCFLYILIISILKIYIFVKTTIFQNQEAAVWSINLFILQIYQVFIYFSNDFYSTSHIQLLTINFSNVILKCKYYPEKKCKSEQQDWKITPGTSSQTLSPIMGRVEI